MLNLSFFCNTHLLAAMRVICFGPVEEFQAISDNYVTRRLRKSTGKSKADINLVLNNRVVFNSFRYV